MGRLESFVEEFDEDYFTLHHSSAKTTNPPSDELGSDDRIQLAAFEMPKAPISPELSLSSPTPAVCYEDSFPAIIGAPTISQIAVTTPSVIVAEIPSITPLLVPATLSVGEEDSLKFSFEATFVVGKASGDSPS